MPLDTSENKELFLRWKSGVDIKVLAKETGVTQEQMRHKLNALEADVSFQLLLAVTGLVCCIEDLRENYDGVYTSSRISASFTEWEKMDESGQLSAWMDEYRFAKRLLARLKGIGK
jgi:hypothetical protein